MTSEQSRKLSELFGMSPDEPCGTEPRYIAVQRVFDPKAADEALEAHDDYWSTERPGPKSTGSAAKSMALTTGGAK